MKEEYKKTNHFQKKIENFKINKIMGRIRRTAKGPNPLSCKKKRKQYNDTANNANNTIVNQELNQNNESNNEPKKRERKRYKKVKNNQ